MINERIKKFFNKRNVFAVVRTRAMGVENMVAQHMKNLRSTEYNVYPIFKCNRDFGDKYNSIFGSFMAFVLLIKRIKRD